MPSNLRLESGLPPVDVRLVAPESRYEAVEGRLVHVAPADEPHGTRHSKVAALLEAHVDDRYDVACDMLTRTSETSDVAPDVSVFPWARDPQTGGRQLEELAFEVVNTQRLNDAGAKAAKLAFRGVRRVFAIDVVRKRAFEWSHALETWEMLPNDGKIDDPSLAVPVPLAALVQAAKADDAVAHALLRKRNPVLIQAIDVARDEGERKGEARGQAEGERRGQAEGERRGQAEGRAQALLAVLEGRGLAVTELERATILATTDLARLDAWLARSLTCQSAAELLG